MNNNKLSTNSNTIILVVMALWRREEITKSELYLLVKS
jgi:hypothetical protein